jgi:alkylhydroperoxidase family enzyme
MSRLQAIQSNAATGKAKELLDAVEAKLKITPNMTRVMANSPAVLEAYLGFSGALSHGTLDAKLREEIALEVGEQNSWNNPYN